MKHESECSKNAEHTETYLVQQNPEFLHITEKNYFCLLALNQRGTSKDSLD
jgi:hypothetical protein